MQTVEEIVNYHQFCYVFTRRRKREDRHEDADDERATGHDAA